VEGSSRKRLRIKYFLVENLEEELQYETRKFGEIQKESIYSMDILSSMFLNPTGEET
jgi:hypothetical protein